MSDPRIIPASELLRLRALYADAPAGLMWSAEVLRLLDMIDACKEALREAERADTDWEGFCGACRGARDEEDSLIKDEDGNFEFHDPDCLRGQILDGAET